MQIHYIKWEGTQCVECDQAENYLHKPTPLDMTSVMRGVIETPSITAIHWMVTDKAQYSISVPGYRKYLESLPSSLIELHWLPLKARIEFKIPGVSLLLKL